MATVSEDIAYLSDIRKSGIIPSDPTEGNVPVFGDDGNLVDSGVKPSDYYNKSEIDEKLQDIDGLDSGIVEEIRGKYSIAAYNSDQWTPLTAYEVGDFCLNGNPKQGYRCIEAHTSSAVFATSKWELVLSGAGKSAIDTMLLECGKDKAPLLSLASAYSSGKRYEKGDLVIKDGRLQVCTTGAYGAGAEFSTNITIDKAISDRVAKHADNENVHVSAEDRQSWDSKQDEISDLSQIRADAEAGASAAARDKIVIGPETVTAEKADGTGQVELAKKSDIPTSVSQLANDEGYVKDEDLADAVDSIAEEKGYLKEHQDLSGKADNSAVDAEYDTTSDGYEIGETCMRLGKFYVCKQKVWKDEAWNASKWELSSLGAAVKSGRLQHQVDWEDDDPDSPFYIKNKPVISGGGEVVIDVDPTLTHEGEAADAKAAGDAIALRFKTSSVDRGYDTTSGGYAVGDTCTRDGKWYKCRVAVSQGAAWNSGSWEEISVKDALQGLRPQVQANWDETDSNDPSFIQNKPTIPRADDLPYKISNAVQGEESNNVIPFSLKDRAVNVINPATAIATGKSFRLDPPSAYSQQDDGRPARDFLVAIYGNSEDEIPVVSSMTMKDYVGGSVTLSVPSEEWVIYRFTEISVQGGTFLVSGASDPAWRAVKEIERALDDILLDGGISDFTPGVFIPDANGLFHRLEAVYDEDIDGYDVGVDSEGVEK